METDLWSENNVSSVVSVMDGIQRNNFRKSPEHVVEFNPPGSRLRLLAIIECCIELLDELMRLIYC